MREESNQLPPEFDHLRDDEFPDVIAPESPGRAADESPLQADRHPKTDKSWLYIAGGLAAVVVMVLVAKQFIRTDTKTVAEHYQALEKIDMDVKPQVKESTGQSKLNGDPSNQPESLKPSIQQYEMAQADTKRDEMAELKQAAESNVDQRLSLVEDAVKKLLMANEGHAQSIELLRNEQAQLMLKMQSNDTALADLRGRVESLHNKVSPPKKSNSNGNQTPSNSISGANKERENSKATKKATKLVGSTQSAKPIEVVTLTPPKPRTQLPASVRLVSLKNLNGKNTAVIRIGGDFSPMLFEGQTWNGIQILSARVYERSARVMYQGDEFGLVL